MRENKEKIVHLSERMAAVTRMVTRGGHVCDVGCDHGFVSIYLVQKQIATKVFAMDVGKGPLLRAIEHINEYELSEEIEVRLSDGLEKIDESDKVDTVIMAGMGGLLMAQIMQKALERGLYIEEYVLQPQSGIDKLRVFLRNNDYIIVNEDMVLEEGKYYSILKVRRKTDAYCMKTGDVWKIENFEKQDDGCESKLCEITIEDIFGHYLLTQKNPVLHAYLQKEKNKFEQICDNMDVTSNGYLSVQEQLNHYKKALHYFE